MGGDLELLIICFAILVILFIIGAVKSLKKTDLHPLMYISYLAIMLFALMAQYIFC